MKLTESRSPGIPAALIVLLGVATPFGAQLSAGEARQDPAGRMARVATHQSGEQNSEPSIGPLNRSVAGRTKSLPEPVAPAVLDDVSTLRLDRSKATWVAIEIAKTRSAPSVHGLRVRLAAHHYKAALRPPSPYWDRVSSPPPSLQLSDDQDRASGQRLAELLPCGSPDVEALARLVYYAAPAQGADVLSGIWIDARSESGNPVDTCILHGSLSANRTPRSDSLYPRP